MGMNVWKKILNEKVCIVKNMGDSFWVPKEKYNLT